MVTWIPTKQDDSLSAMTPVSIDGSVIEMCRLDFETYAQRPHSYPMFKDLTALSNCKDNARFIKKKDLIADIVAQAGSPHGRVVYPTAFIFHESRVGSTLVANMLGSDPSNLVFSESSVPASLFKTGCSPRQFRETLLLMGRSATHTKLFFKFQSITTLSMQIALEAFPDVPWIFIFRKPVQVLMSHLDPRSLTKVGSTPPCLRNRYDRLTRSVISKFTDNVRTASGVAICAAHLSNLCNAALSAHKTFGYYQSFAIAEVEAEDVGRIPYKFIRASAPLNMSLPRGYLLEYDSLPGALPRVLSSLFGVQLSRHWLERMRTVSTEYSKGM